MRTYENLELTDGATVYLNHVAPAVNEPDFAFYGPSILKGDGDFVFGDGSTPGKVNVWVFDNAGTGVGTINAGITMRSGSVNADFRPSNDAVSIINEGTIRADNGRTISITSIKFLNVGTVEAAGGGIVGLSEGRFLNYSAGVVTGGTYIARRGVVVHVQLRRRCDHHKQRDDDHRWRRRASITSPF